MFAQARRLGGLCGLRKLFIGDVDDNDGTHNLKIKITFSDGMTSRPE
jgi:hypothetical protein